MPLRPVPRDRGVRRRRPRAVCVRAALALVLLLPGAAAAQRVPEDAVELLSVRFAGADRVPTELLRTAIVSVPTQCVSAALQPLCWVGISLDRHYVDVRALASDVFRLRVFYYQRGYRDARIELDTLRTAAGMHVVFRIAEGEPVVVRGVTLEGAEALDPPVTRNLPLREGRPFSMIEFEATRDTLVHRLANRGYPAAEVLANYDIPAGGGLHADVAYQLIPGASARFGAIRISGLERVAPGVVERMLVFREGDTFSRQALLRSQRNLFALEVFRHAEIQAAVPAAGDTVLPVHVRVSEGDMHRVRVGLGMSTTDYLNAEGRWVSRNFFGGGRRLEVRGRITNIIATPLRYIQPPFEPCAGIYCDLAGSLSADFSQPWFFGPQNALGAGVFLERFSLPGVYVRTSRGAYASIRRSVLRTGALTGLYRPELTQLESDGDLIFCINFVVCEEREIDLLRSPQWLAPVGVAVTLDRSNSLFAPTRGYILRLDTEYAAAATGSDFAYARLSGEAAGYHDPFRGVVVAARLRPGWARAVGDPGTGLGLHPQKRFFAGGPNSVRGFAQYRLGPKLLTVAADTLAPPSAQGGAGCSAQEINAGTCDAGALARAHPGAFEVRPVGGAVSMEGNIELRYPIWADKLRGATFLDFGQVWRGHADVRFSELRFTPGVGVRYFSPVGPIRIDVGYNTGVTERLTVITTEVCDMRMQPCGDILPDVTYAPDQLGTRRKLRTLPAIDWRPQESFTDRLQLHFSIGQAF
jgi:outer membrane protein assembly factor BamA